MSDKFILKSLINFIIEIINYLNPLSEKFILKGLINFIREIIDYLNPFSENFFAYKLLELLGNLLKWLFIPDDNYFSNVKETLLSDLQTKLPYQDYINMFGTILDIAVDGQMEDISIENYKIGEKEITLKSFIDFSVITKYRPTWYAWVRGFVFIFLIIYHVNQLTKFFRGFSITDGSIAKVSDTNQGGN